MEIKLTKRESEEYFHLALCSGGIEELQHCGIVFDYNNEEYKAAKKSLVDKSNGECPNNICLEDVWMEMLRMGKILKFVDEEDGNYSKDVTLEMVHDNVQKMPLHHILNYINNDDDSISAFILLQTVLYDGEIPFA